MKRFHLLLLFPALMTQEAGAGGLDRSGTQWRPYLEWSLQNPSCQGNPFDLEATVTFEHAGGERRTTGMFYDGNGKWSFRFTATRAGRWTFVTTSEDPDLNGKEGTVQIQPNPDKKAHGFLKSFGSKWGWSGTETAFTPQLVMYDEPPAFHRQPAKIDRDIQTFLVEHGFNGFHTTVLCRWFDLEKTRATEIKAKDPNPDPRTFEALELLITKVHAAGGMVHIWVWGDEQRRMTPILWGKNQKVDQRLQRYMAARLGPLPGWSMGYGFDLFEWTGEKDLTVWHDYMQSHLGWKHFLGGRSGGPRSGLDHAKEQISESLDYSAYEHHRPTYDVYVAALEARPNKPSFSEDRFRIRNPSPYPDKDYTEPLTRRGLWHSTMAGGVANIWGNLPSRQSVGSGPYENVAWINTWSKFFERRFLPNLVRDNQLTDGVCLRTPDRRLLLCYKEDCGEVRVEMPVAPAQAIAIDALKPYREIAIALNPGRQIWKAPYKSDWALAIETAP